MLLIINNYARDNKTTTKRENIHIQSIPEQFKNKRKTGFFLKIHQIFTYPLEATVSKTKKITLNR